MSDKPRKTATYQDIIEAPDTRVSEIVEGDLLVSPRPAPRHAAARSVIGGVIIGPFQLGTGGPGG